MSSKPRLVLPIVAALLIAAGAVAIVKVNGDRQAPGPAAPLPQSTRTGGSPNVLVIMTDDQTLESMRVLDNVDRYLIDQGTTYTNYFTSFPTCCPSRVTYMSGQFAHNHGVRENVKPTGGYHKANQDEYLPVWLQRAGYWTGSVGKYLNEYGEDGNITPPNGWNRWFGLIDPWTYRYFNYQVSVDGQRQVYGDAPEDYQTDVLGGEVVRIITERATTDQPWFLSWTPLAPHAQEPEGRVGTGAGEENDNSGKQTIAERIRSTFPTPAPEFAGKMANQEMPRTPAYNQQDISRSPSFIRNKQPFNINVAALIRDGYRRELESLLSVDKWVKRIMDTLVATKQLDDTVVVFTSDNGYFHGEHRLSFSKVFLYEPAVHLPLVIRGKGFPAGAKVPDPVSNVDLAPTILKLAGATAAVTPDGRDVGSLATAPGTGMARGVLLENWRENGQNHSYGIRTDRYKYLVHKGGEEELFDLAMDPHEVRNLAADPSMAAVKAELGRRLDVLRTCKAAACEGFQAA